jgi:branched-chain amino acid transport system ATP-binding protein
VTKRAGPGALEVDGIDVFYGETQVLFGVSLRVGAGEVVSVLGPNGAGKTTTLRAILGLTPARRGRIRFRGDDIVRRETHQIARAGIGWVPDDRRVFPTLTVERNLTIARKRSPFPAWPLASLLEVFSPLRYLMRREAGTLSGGEAQMVAIARALVGGPALVLFDEPTQGLAPAVAQTVMRTISKMKADGIASLVVEQNAVSALAVSDRVYVLDLGRVVHKGPAAELLEDPALRTRLLGF